ncbi:glutathione S-transferase [Pandoraea terrae]|uniref:Glutathione S-transferase n=1 Tax=Pandoraea terrae TaxID=1537710 RepID=A0A5E4VV53_9BURK|nr:glutathione S-transferase [Pandoraea terrae]VVE15459.1 glutathione S-transferase [Pandoraea terrae]
MLTLCGFAISNYYNKVKLILIEKGLPFEESLSLPSQDAALLAHSPLGKVPYLQTENGWLCESQAIADYLEMRYPETPLLSRDPWRNAKERELLTMLELHLELVARELYGQAFFGRTITDEAKARAEKLLRRHIEAFKRLAKFSPYVAGETFSMVDCAAVVHLPLVGMATQTVFGTDFLQEAGVDWKAYTKSLGERASVQRVVADRKAYMAQQAEQAGK